MTEISKDLPKSHPVRNAIAKQIREIRTIERMGIYETDRDGVKYSKELLGVRELFNYIRNLGTSNVVLDVGAGSTVGIDDLAHSSIGHDLRFEATVLIRKSLGLQETADSKVHVTSAEVLRGISDNSIGAALAIQSVGYSDAPRAAIASIDRVLVPGGVFKGSFYKSSDVGGTQNMLGLKNYPPFQDALESLGYDIAVDESNYTSNLLLAIKPGGDIPKSAKELLEEDKRTLKEQLALLLKENVQKGDIKDLLK